MSDEDMLVYPEEFKMGMKEELEHKDTVEGDKETIKKIVLDHLKENPRYYTKLKEAFKAEEVKDSHGTEWTRLPGSPSKMDVGKMRQGYHDSIKKLLNVKRAEEEMEDKLSTKLLNKAEEELGKDKVDEIKNKTIIEDFAKEQKKAEEKLDEPAFHAEPAEAGIGDSIKKILNPAPKMPEKHSVIPLTKKTIRSFRH